MTAKQQTIDELVAQMIEGIEAVTLAEKKEGVIPRFNQAKTIACLRAEFTVHDDVPAVLRHGLFAKPATYPALLRFASASKRDDSQKDIRGLSIRVMNVPGPVLWGQAGLQDFLLNSYPALFVTTPEDFLAFIRARKVGREFGFFLNPFNPHLQALGIVLKAQKKHLSPLDIRYFSTVPFRLGETGGLAVKYSATPCSTYTTATAVEAGENQLRAAIKAHLEQGEAFFHFGVQRRTDPDTMPIEDASVIWDEGQAPFETVATITIARQDFVSPPALADCERSSFNPWQCLAAHAPLGRMNEVRRLVYAHAAQLRNKE
jgi:catalase